MTKQKHLKALIRSRQARTGESYSIARKRVLERIGDWSPNLHAEFRAHDRHCNVIRFDPGGDRIFTGGFEGQARVWSTTDWSMAGELVGHAKSVNGVALGETRAVSVSSDNSARLWDLEDLKEVAVLHEDRRQVVAVDLGVEGSLAVTGGFDARVRGWSLGGEQVFDIEAPGRVTSLAVDPISPRVAIGVLGQTVSIVEDERVVTDLEAPGEATVSLRWSRDGTMLVGSGPEGRIVAWSSDDWEIAREVEAPGGGMVPVAIDPLGASFAVGWQGQVGVWTARSDVPAIRFEGLPKGVYSVDFSPDGRLLAQAGADGRVRVWSLA